MQVKNLTMSQLVQLIKLHGGGGGGGAPTDAQYVVLATDGDLSAERVLTAGTNITLTDAGAGGAITIGASGGSGDVVAGSTFTTAGVIMACDGDDKTIDAPNATLTTNSQALTVGGDLTVTGDVGIGGAPSTILHVQADDPRIRVEATTNNHPGYEISEDGTRKWLMYNDPADDNLKFKSNTDDVDRFELSQTGDLQIDGDLTVDGNDIYNGRDAEQAVIAQMMLGG